MAWSVSWSNGSPRMSLAWNGAAMARALHMAAHGDTSMVLAADRHKAEFVQLGVSMVQDASNENPDGYRAAAESLGGFEAAGERARRMVDHVSWDAHGEVVRPQMP